MLAFRSFSLPLFVLDSPQSSYFMAELSRSFALGVDAANSISVEASDETSLKRAGVRKRCEAVWQRLAGEGAVQRAEAGGAADAGVAGDSPQQGVARPLSRLPADVTRGPPKASTGVRA